MSSSYKCNNCAILSLQLHYDKLLNVGLLPNCTINLYRSCFNGCMSNKNLTLLSWLDTDDLVKQATQGEQHTSTKSSTGFRLLHWLTELRAMQEQSDTAAKKLHMVNMCSQMSREAVNKPWGKTNSSGRENKCEKLHDYPKPSQFTEWLPASARTYCIYSSCPIRDYY